MKKEESLESKKTFNPIEKRSTNINKFFIGKIILHLIEENKKQNPAIVKYLLRIKKMAKRGKKSDLYNLSHFRLMFLYINEANFSLL